MKNNASEHTPTYLAWLDWYADDQNRKRCNFSITDQPISDSVVKQIKATVRGIAEIRPLLIMFEMFLRNYRDLEDAYRETDQALTTDSFRQIEWRAIDRHALLQQRVINFVNSAALMLERAKSRMNALPNMRRFDLAKAQLKEREAYDKFRSYRLCCNLRNYSQHDDLPIHAIPSQGRSTSEGWEYSFQMVLSSENLKSAKKKLRDVVTSDYDGLVDLEAELEEYFFVCAELFAYMAHPALERIHTGIQLRNEVLKFRPEEYPDAEPILWQGDLPDDEGTSQFDGSSLSFWEIERWGATYKSIRDIAPGFTGVFRELGKS